MNNISEHISYEEATRSLTAQQLGLENKPNAVHLAAMRLVAGACFEPARRHAGGPILVTSFFRTLELNRAIGGANSSQHIRGEAIDMKAPAEAKYTSADIFHYIRKNCEFDQLIWEFGTDKNPDWVHVSFSLARNNRKEVLRAMKEGGRTVYQKK
jgi:D-alanyl-D-alanine dipeptidase